MSTTKKTFIKTKPCPIQINEGVCKNEGCNYAHSMDELKHVECNFGVDCNKKDTLCNFKHPDETVEEFRKRIDFVEPIFISEKKKDENNSENSDDDNKISKITLPPFVLDMNDKMSHVVASMALLMNRDVKWVDSNVK